MKKLINITTITLILFAFMGTSTLYAQEWTKEQKEVWQTVEDYWVKWQAKDFDGAFANIHDKYLGWYAEDPLPTSKEKWYNSMNKYKEFISKLNYDVEPARILVHGDVAVVHLYYSFSLLYDDGENKKKVSYSGKWTEFFIKEDGKWMLIGDLTTEDDDD